MLGSLGAQASKRESHLQWAAQMHVLDLALAESVRPKRGTLGAAIPPANLEHV